MYSKLQMLKGKTARTLYDYVVILFNKIPEGSLT